MNFFVDMFHIRSHPSSWELEVFRSLGQRGHGSFSVRCSGGFGRSSSWVTLRAPWRFAVPTQSEPVSPPPMTTTFLS